MSLRTMLSSAFLVGVFGIAGCGGSQPENLSQSTGGEESKPADIQKEMEKSREMMMKSQQQQGKKGSMPEPKARAEEPKAE